MIDRLTKSQLKLEIVRCRNERELIKSWTNCTNMHECSRSIKFLDDLIDKLTNDLEVGNYIEDNPWDKE